MFEDNQRVKRYLVGSYWTVTVPLVAVAELLAIIAARETHGPGLVNLKAPLAALLPLFVLLPGLVALMSYRRLAKRALAADPTGELSYVVSRAFLQTTIFEYVAVVWALSLLLSALRWIRM